MKIPRSRPAKLLEDFYRPMNIKQWKTNMSIIAEVMHVRWALGRCVHTIQMLKLCSVYSLKATSGPSASNGTRTKAWINSSMWSTKSYSLCKVCPHACVDAIRASRPYRSLTSDSCLVLWAYVCSPFRHSLIRTSAVSPKSNSLSQLLFRVFFCNPLSPGFPLLSPSSMYCNFSRVHKTIWHFRLCWGPVGPNLPAETLRAQRHPTVHWAAAGPIGLNQGRYAE